MTTRSLVPSLITTAITAIPLLLVLRSTGNAASWAAPAVLALTWATAWLSALLALSGRLTMRLPARRRGHSQRETGKVKWFNTAKGYGFITRDSGDDVFVHFRAIRGTGHRSLRDGQRVEFFVSQAEKGPQADDVKRL